MEGFTLVEVLVVLGVLTFILGATVVFDMTGYRGDAFRAERTTLVTALQTARADALNNVQQSKHGVAINPDGFAGYVLFAGDRYADADPVTRTMIPMSYPVTFGSTSPREVVFDQLSGDTGFNGQTEIIDQGRSATTAIVINYEGKIGW